MFSFYCLPLQYQIDISSVTKLHRQYQTILHPDKFAQKDDDFLEKSAQLSAYASTSLETLADPVERACSLLELVSEHRALEETDRVDNDLAIEVFAIREEIDDAETADEVLPVQIEINQRYEDEQE